jgi:hypothetical protein
VLLLPPAPAARVEFGLAEAALSARSAAAFLLMAVAGPPGALAPGAFAPVVVPEEGPVGAGDPEGDDWKVEVRERHTHRERAREMDVATEPMHHS